MGDHVHVLLGAQSPVSVLGSYLCHQHVLSLLWVQWWVVSSRTWAHRHLIYTLPSGCLGASKVRKLQNKLEDDSEEGCGCAGRLRAPLPPPQVLFGSECFPHGSCHQVSVRVPPSLAVKPPPAFGDAQGARAEAPLQVKLNTKRLLQSLPPQLSRSSNRCMVFSESFSRFIFKRVCI